MPLLGPSALYEESKEFTNFNKPQEIPHRRQPRPYGFDPPPLFSRPFIFVNYVLIYDLIDALSKELRAFFVRK